MAEVNYGKLSPRGLVAQAKMISAARRKAEELDARGVEGAAETVKRYETLGMELVDHVESERADDERTRRQVTAYLR